MSFARAISLSDNYLSIWSCISNLLGETRFESVVDDFTV